MNFFQLEFIFLIQFLSCVNEKESDALTLLFTL